MTLQDRLDALKADFEGGKFACKPGPDVLDTMRRATSELVASGQALNARKAGDKAPEFALKDPDNHKYTFLDVKIGAGKYIKVRTGSGTDTTATKYQDRKAYVWNNTSDTATLLKAGGSKVDSCSWSTRDGSDKYC